MESPYDQVLLFTGSYEGPTDRFPSVLQRHDFVGFVQNAGFAVQYSCVALFNFAIAEVSTNTIDCVTGQITQADVKGHAVELVLFKLTCQRHFKVGPR